MTTRQDQIKLLATQIAAYCYAQALLNTQSGNWNIYENELEDYFYVKGFSLADDELRNSIIEQLQEYPGLAEVEITFDEGIKEYDIDMLLWLAYCPQNDENENYFSSENYNELKDFEKVEE